MNVYASVVMSLYISVDVASSSSSSSSVIFVRNQRSVSHIRVGVTEKGETPNVSLTQPKGLERCVCDLTSLQEEGRLLPMEEETRSGTDCLGNNKKKKEVEEEGRRRRVMSCYA